MYCLWLWITFDILNIFSSGQFSLKNHDRKYQVPGWQRFRRKTEGVVIVCTLIFWIFITFLEISEPLNCVQWHAKYTYIILCNIRSVYNRSTAIIFAIMSYVNSIPSVQSIMQTKEWCIMYFSTSCMSGSHPLTNNTKLFWK